jgi:hypothetical protein
MAQKTKTFLSYNGCSMPSVGLAFSHNLLFCLLTDGISSKYDSSENINDFDSINFSNL